MTNWKDNPIMFWNDGINFVQVSDHNRGSLNITYERIGTDTRMVDGSLRRWSVAKKRTFELTWEKLPARTVPGALNPVDGGMDGESLELFYHERDGEFEVKVRAGDGTEELVTVMFTDFSKEIVKRGVKNDMWNVNATLEEV